MSTILLLLCFGVTAVWQTKRQARSKSLTQPVPEKAKSSPEQMDVVILALSDDGELIPIEKKNWQ